ncbi:MAG: hypothetical protein WC837_08595 [Bellilinea sp.]
MLDKLTSADFVPYLNQAFIIDLDGSVPYPLVLVSATELGEARNPGGRRPFSLIFSNPRKDAYLSQQIYRLAHEKMGSLELFLVPLGPDQTGMRYEAIFS